jgi:hypothetical protein
MTYSSSERTVDSENRTSITGCIVFELGIPICWRLNDENNITLSSCEIQYMAMLEAFMKISVVYPLKKTWELR